MSYDSESSPSRLPADADRSLPYVERRALLEGARAGRCLLDIIGSLDCDPLDALTGCLGLGIEGLVAKRADSP